MKLRFGQRSGCVKDVFRFGSRVVQVVARTGALTIRRRVMCMRKWVALGIDWGITEEGSEPARTGKSLIGLRGWMNSLDMY